MSWSVQLINEDLCIMSYQVLCIKPKLSYFDWQCADYSIVLESKVVVYRLNYNTCYKYIMYIFYKIR